MADNPIPDPENWLDDYETRPVRPRTPLPRPTEATASMRNRPKVSGQPVPTPGSGDQDPASDQMTTGLNRRTTQPIRTTQPSAVVSEAPEIAAEPVATTNKPLYIIPPKSGTLTSLIQMFTRRLGGPMGAHVGKISRGWAYICATLAWMLCMARQIPCVRGTSHTMGWMCYSDLTALYGSRGQATGGIPYVNVDWEYPVLTGYFVTIANWISKLFGAVLSPEANDIPNQLSTNTHIYFAVNAIMLFACLLWLIRSVLKLVPNVPQLAMLVAVLPAVWTTGLINWDLLAVALTAAGLVAWKDQNWILSGVWWGLAIAAKFYPLVIIGALFILCVRPDAFRPLVRLLRSWPQRVWPLIGWLIMMGSAVVTWLLVDLPVMITHYSGWAYFFIFNAKRSADLGSFWYALSLAGVSPQDPRTWAIWSRAVMILGYAALAALIYIARRPPTVIQIAYLAVAVLLVGNLVYSPQYVLWILPLVVLARPKALDLSIFATSEVFYYIFIWLYLGGYLWWGGTGIPVVYIFAIFVRIAGTIFVMTRVVREVLGLEPKDREFIALTMGNGEMR